MPDKQQLFNDLDETWVELISRVSDNGYDVNEIPFRDSWTIAQLTTHVTKSNKVIADALEMKGQPAERDPEAGVSNLKKTFLDFDTKLKSPDIIIPEERNYIREDVIGFLTDSINKLKADRSAEDLLEIVNIPIFGAVTKLELLHFVLYHTQRHVHQLKNMLKALKNSHQ